MSDRRTLEGIPEAARVRPASRTKARGCPRLLFGIGEDEGTVVSRELHPGGDKRFQRIVELRFSEQIKPFSGTRLRL
jgi:hypothetical protein